LLALGVMVFRKSGNHGSVVNIGGMGTQRLRDSIGAENESLWHQVVL